mgnify:CR=1 FL=1
MKHEPVEYDENETNVALFTGAWIETRQSHRGATTTPVALFTGAWIETKRETTSTDPDASRALYGRVD